MYVPPTLSSTLLYDPLRVCVHVSMDAYKRRDIGSYFFRSYVTVLDRESDMRQGSIAQIYVVIETSKRVFLVRRVDVLPRLPAEGLDARYDMM